MSNADARDAEVPKVLVNRLFLLNIEAAIRRYKQVIGDGLRFRKDARRDVGVRVCVPVLNRMLERGRPIFVRIE